MDDDLLDALDTLERHGVTTGAEFEQARFDAAMAAHGGWAGGKCWCGTPCVDSAAWNVHYDQVRAALDEPTEETTGA